MGLKDILGLPKSVSHSREDEHKLWRSNPLVRHSENLSKPQQVVENLKNLPQDVSHRIASAIGETLKPHEYFTEPVRLEDGLVRVYKMKGKRELGYTDIDPTTIAGNQLIQGFQFGGELDPDQISLASCSLTGYQAYMYPEQAKKILGGK